MGAAPRLRVGVGVRIPAPAQQVWDALTDWERQGEWMVGTRVRATYLDGRAVGGRIEAWTGLGSVGFLVHEVARLLKRRFEDEARIHGVTLPQWRALAEISNSEGISQVSLANAVDTDPMTMSGILDRLEKRGLIERFVDPNDSRAKLARMTAEGEPLR